MHISKCYSAIFLLSSGASRFRSFFMYFLRILFLLIFKLVCMSLSYNVVFAIELIMKILINPKAFLISWWTFLSFIIIISSVGSIYLEYKTETKDYRFLKSVFMALQLFRFCLIFKDVVLLKKFFLTLKTIFAKSAPIITLFFLILFFFSLLGINNNKYLKI